MKWKWAEKWRKISNVILKHQEILFYLIYKFNKYLKSSGMLEMRNLDELSGFSNKTVILFGRR